MRKTGHAHRHREADVAPLVSHDLRRALAPQTLHARMRSGQADTRQQHRKARVVNAARGVHCPRVAAQQPPQGLMNARPRGHAERLHVGGQRVEFDRHQRELTVFACRQIDLAPQLVLEVSSVVEAGLVVAQCVVLHLTAQLLVGALLRLELLDRRRPLRLASLQRNQVAPHRGQHRAPIAALQALAQHAELAPLAAPLESMLAEEGVCLRQCRLVGRAHRRGCGGLEQVGVSASDDFRRNHSEPLEDARVGMQIGAAAGILREQTVAVTPQQGWYQCAKCCQRRNRQRPGWGRVCAGRGGSRS